MFHFSFAGQAIPTRKYSDPSGTRSVSGSKNKTDIAVEQIGAIIITTDEHGTARPMASRDV